MAVASVEPAVVRAGYQRMSAPVGAFGEHGTKSLTFFLIISFPEAPGVFTAHAHSCMLMHAHAHACTHTNTYRHTHQTHILSGLRVFYFAERLNL